MVSQQMAIKNTLIDAVSNLEGVEINIDMNETKLTEGIRDFARELINATIINNPYNNLTELEVKNNE